MGGNVKKMSWGCLKKVQLQSSILFMHCIIIIIVSFLMSPKGRNAVDYKFLCFDIDNYIWKSEKLLHVLKIHWVFIVEGWNFFYDEGIENLCFIDPQNRYHFLSYPIEQWIHLLHLPIWIENFGFYYLTLLCDSTAWINFIAMIEGASNLFNKF